VKVKILRDESGQTLVIAALCMTCLMGFMALSVDIGLMLRAKRVLQTAADSAAIAGAAELISGTWAAAARADAAQNGVTDGVNGATVTPHNGPSTGPHAGNLAYVEVIVAQTQPTFFMKVFGTNSMTVVARAVATTVPNPSCIITLGTAAPGVSISNGASLLLPTCGIIDDATGGGALTATGGASITATGVGVVGTATISNGATVNPTPATGITAASDPLSSLTAPPASDYSSGCLADPHVHTNQTIGPSAPGGFICYNGLSFTNGAPTVTLNPGLYIINGPNSLNVASGTTLNGTGVTFYFVNNASFTISNGATLNLSAPTSGAYSGLLFYQDVNDSSADTFTGGSSGALNGIFYLPAAPLTLQNGSSTTFNVDLVVRSLTMTGAATLHPYAPLTGASPLSNPRLVE
jgi:Flp pilus assembly protein TadG